MSVTQPVEPLAMPADDWSSFVRDRAESSLAAARDVVARLKDGTVRTAEEILELWNAGEIATSNASGFVELLSEVHPDAAVRELADAKLQETAAFVTERGQDRALYEAMAAVDPAGLDADAVRLLERTLRDFRRAGVDRDDATRARLSQISARSTVIEQEFSSNVRDDVRSIRIASECLAGLPQDFIDAHPADDEGLVTITTDYPDTRPFLVYAQDRQARHDISRTFNSRGWPVNDALLHELLDLRHEQAQLLGYDSWPDFDAEVKMIGTGSAIGAFIDRIS